MIIGRVKLFLFFFGCCESQCLKYIGLLMQVLLMSLKAGGVGINLTAASHAFLLVCETLLIASVDC